MLSGEQYLLEAYRANKAPMAAWLNIYNREFLLDNDLWFKKGILHEDEQFTLLEPAENSHYELS